MINRREFVKSLTAFVAGISFLPLLPIKKKSKQKDTQTTVSDKDARLYYVNGITGSDSNPGTKDKPFATINAPLREVIIDRPTFFHIGQHPFGGYEAPILLPKTYGNGTLWLIGEIDSPPIIDMTTK